MKVLTDRESTKPPLDEIVKNHDLETLRGKRANLPTNDLGNVLDPELRDMLSEAIQLKQKEEGDLPSL